MKMAYVTVLCLVISGSCGCAMRLPGTVLNDVPPYSGLIDREYKLVVDCYLVRDMWDGEPGSLVPEGFRGGRIPEPVSEVHIGEKLSGSATKIEGVVRSGAVFKVVRVVNFGSYLNNYMVVFPGGVDSNQVVDALHLVDDMTGEGVDFCREYAIPLVEQTGEVVSGQGRLDGGSP